MIMNCPRGGPMLWTEAFQRAAEECFYRLAGMQDMAVDRG